MIVLVFVHLIVVPIQLVIRDDELVRVGIVVVRRYVEDVLALHVGGRDRDVRAVVILAGRDGRRLAAARALQRTAAPAGSAAPSARLASARLASARLASARLASTRMASARLASARLASARLASGATKCARHR